jgi:type IV secretory pathway VirB9-like protein
MKRLLLVALIGAGVLATGLRAQELSPILQSGPSVRVKQDPFEQTKLVAFNYSEHETYPVISRSGMFTVISVEEGEVVQGFYLSDTDQWGSHIAGDKRHVFVKPSAGGLFNSATLITSKRTYLLAMTSNTDGMWYQKVHWNIPENKGPQGHFEEYATGGASGVVKADGPPNFEYDIDGGADFRPVSVYDNGKFTRFVLPKNAQELPALFSLNAQGEPEVVNYTVQGNALQVNRLMHGALLKLGKEEVRVYNRAMRPEKKSWFSPSGWGG